MKPSGVVHRPARIAAAARHTSDAPARSGTDREPCRINSSPIQAARRDWQVDRTVQQGQPGDRFERSPQSAARVYGITGT
jgi:hypothetical protein